MTADHLTGTDLRETLRRRQARYDTRHLELERLVAHRDLQLQRVQSAPRKAARDRGARIALRFRLLVEAQDALRRLEQRRDAWIAGDLATVYGDARASGTG